MSKKIFISLVLMLILSIGLSYGLNNKQKLGKKIFFDKIADPDRMSCANCHAPQVGFTGPISGVNNKGSVYAGAIPQRFGNRKPPSAAYATLSPNLYFDGELFIGGNFWDGRATGWRLDSPAAEQALGPFLNPVEQNVASKKEVLIQIANAKYAYLWEIVWGAPISWGTQTEIDQNYDRIGLSIAAYEGSNEVNPFTSKYDYFVQGKVQLTDLELEGLDLFNGKALCADCHVPPDFTDYSFDNLGIPKNPKNPFYDMDKVYLDDGTPINPLGDAWIDYGLGDFLRQLADPNNQSWRSLPYVDPVIAAMTNSALANHATANDGKHKVPTLRNVDKKPGSGFVKAYGHNGFFKSLEEITHFYNTRDVETWPAPEVAANVNTDELGNLGLTPAEEAAIVAFMKTLSDGYKLPKLAKSLVSIPETSSLQIIGANPFNPSTRFNISLAHASEIQLDVFNVIGQKVTTLISGKYNAGEYTVDFIAGDLPSGTYFIILQTEQKVFKEKVTLLK